MQKKKVSLIAAVIPCFNEAATLRNVCDSLAFGKFHEQLARAILIIVDNNSSDQSATIAMQIKAECLPNTVFVISEKEQGYIPARSAGIRFLESFCNDIDLPFDEVFVCQVDADSIYSPNYLLHMGDAASTVGFNIIYSALTMRPAHTDALVRRVDYLTKSIDDAFFANQPEADYIIDDKASGFWLHDFFKWGGYKREYISGKEIFAETTRLCLKAVARGAEREEVPQASVIHSLRKINDNPLVYIASAGYPRHSMHFNKFNGRDFITMHDSDIAIQDALQLRKKHLFALYTILPRHVYSALTNMKGTGLAGMPERSFEDLCQRPGLFLEDSFAYVEI